MLSLSLSLLSSSPMWLCCRENKQPIAGALSLRYGFDTEIDMLVASCIYGLCGDTYQFVISNSKIYISYTETDDLFSTLH
jgi:hypothetical protein